MNSLKDPKIKAVFFDIDGTIFILKTKSIPESTRRAIRISGKKELKLLLIQVGLSMI